MGNRGRGIPMKLSLASAAANNERDSYLLQNSICYFILLTCMSVHHACAWYPQRLEKVAELELQMVVKCHVSAGELKPVLTEKQ